jgi:hypothetical protein
MSPPFSLSLLVTRGDHTTAGCNLFIMPPHTEAVVFSLDGALADNFSLSGKTMKCKPGAVQVASHWRDLGYLLVYLTGRPDVQKDTIMKFLAANGFPLGVVACADSITDPHLKTLYLARLIKEVMRGRPSNHVQTRCTRLFNVWQTVGAC